MGSQNFAHTFSMALYHKWNVKNDFTFVFQFFSLISDGLGGVMDILIIDQLGFASQTSSPFLIRTIVKRHNDRN